MNQTSIEEILKDMQQANEEASLVRKAYNEEIWGEYETCRYAFFPGCQLGASEPEIVIKAYQTLLFQYPDTAIFLQCCGFPCEMAEDKSGCKNVIEDIKSKWEYLGKPTMIIACMACLRLFQKYLPDIPLVSIYEIFRDHTISGGCNSEDYCIYIPEADKLSLQEEKAIDAIKTLADLMGVKRHEGSSYPFITYSIKQRDTLKHQGKDAVHILELVFGMGDSNLHMTHEHEHEHGDHEDAPAHDDHMPDTYTCAGDCSSCSSCGSIALCEKPDPEVMRVNLPDAAQRWQNRLDLKNALLEFFWNEF